MTPSEPFARELLAARDARQEALSFALSRALSAGKGKKPMAALFVSLNIPGREKTPPGAEAFFSWMTARIEEEFPGAARLVSASDALGPYLILGIFLPSPLAGEEPGERGSAPRSVFTPAAIKRRCVALETAHPSARLIDIDVYTPDGTQIDRAALGLPARACLVCERRAVDCIRARRHDYGEIIAKARELLRRGAW